MGGGVRAQRLQLVQLPQGRDGDVCQQEGRLGRLVRSVLRNCRSVGLQQLQDGVSFRQVVLQCLSELHRQREPEHPAVRRRRRGSATARAVLSEVAVCPSTCVVQVLAFLSCHYRFQVHVVPI